MFCSRSILRLTLPAGVFGSSVTNSICLGYSCWLSRVRTRVLDVPRQPGPGDCFGTMKALTTWPRVVVGHADHRRFGDVGMLA